jgi:hypothetical protein
MLTQDKLRTYEAFGGDSDGHARAAPSAQNPSMSNDDWSQIDELLTGLDSAASGLASPSFVDEIEHKLQAATPDESTRMTLRELALRLRKPA